MSPLETAVRAVLALAAEHQGSVSSYVILTLREGLGEPLAQETREPEE